MPNERGLVWKVEHNFYGFDPETYPIDELDQKIIGLLLENCRKSNTEIAKHIGVNESTVRRRIDTLVSKGIVKGFTICLNNPITDSGVRAYIYVKVDTPTLDEVVDFLCTSTHSLSVYRIVGAYDVVCEMVFDTMGELHKFYDTLFKRPAVQDIMAQIVVNCYKELPLIISRKTPSETMR